MEKRTIKPLSGNGKDIIYQKKEGAYHITWGSLKFEIESYHISKILSDFFVDEIEWYALGASMTEPIPGGLGDFISKFQKLTPRHASAIAAILVDDGLLIARGN